MDFKENVINLFNILALPRAQLFGPRGPDFARGPLIEDLWPTWYTGHKIMQN